MNQDVEPYSPGNSSIITRGSGEPCSPKRTSSGITSRPPPPPEAFPVFCNKKGCGREIINVSFYGYCVSCALNTKDRRRASYLLPKEIILEGLGQVLREGPELVALIELSRKIKKMP